MLSEERPKKRPAPSRDLSRVCEHRFCRPINFIVCYGTQTRTCPEGAPDIGDCMEIEDWRRKIDELDRQIVALISERAEAAQAIGKLKRNTSMPIYEPNRERVIFENVRAANRGPLPDIELVHIYERIIDVMRALQGQELASRARSTASGSGE